MFIITIHKYNLIIHGRLESINLIFPQKQISSERKRLLNSYNITIWTFSGLDPADFRRPTDLPPALSDFGTVAENRVSSSNTSNSGALDYSAECQQRKEIKKQERKKI